MKIGIIICTLILLFFTRAISQVTFGKFSFETVSIENELDLNYFAEYIKEVNSKFNIIPAAKIIVYKGKGLEIYNYETDDIITTIRTVSDTFSIRLSKTRDANPTLYKATCSKILRNLLIPFELYFKENKIDAEFTVTETGENSILVSLGEISDSTTQDILYPNNDHIKFSREELDKFIADCKASGLLDSYPEQKVTECKKYLYEYLHTSRADFFWYFKDLIVPVSPSESGPYKTILRDLEQVANGRLTISNYSEKYSLTGLDISFDVNGEKFTSNNLPKFVSLQLLYDLNSFLLEKFNSQYYIFRWDRSPWEQMIFIYLTQEQASSVNNSKFCKVSELTKKSIDFYDEEQHFEDKIKKAIESEFEKIGFKYEVVDTNKNVMQLFRRYEGGYEVITSSSRVYTFMNYFTTSFSLIKHFDPLHDGVSKYHITNKPSSSSIWIPLNAALDEEQKSKLKYGRELSFSYSGSGLDSLGLECSFYIEKYLLPFSEKMNDVNELNTYFNSTWSLPSEKINMLGGSHYNKTLTRLFIAKHAADQDAYHRIYSGGNKFLKGMVDRAVKKDNNDDELTYRKYLDNLAAFDKDINGVKPLKNKNLFERPGKNK